jgi:radical SAM superfamily enzyme YgiQ (UPF0313 family)
MKVLILGENCLLKLSSFDKSIFSAFSFISSIYARQIAATTPKGHTVKVIDKSEDIDLDKKFDAVHIHFKTGTTLKAYELADKFRNKGNTVILSGSHASALPEEAKAHADSVIIGSAENLWPIIFKDLEDGKLKSFYKSDKNQDSISPINFSIPPELKLMGIVEATRGCPYKCDFCQESNILNGSVFRTRAVKEVVEEIKSFQQKVIFFCDASMTIDVSYTKELFKSMKGLNKKFICEGNVDVLATDEELLKLSHEAGCIEWTVGFESFAQQTLDSVHKNTNKTEDFYNAVKKVHRYKMSILGNFIFGFDDDNPDVFEFTEKNLAKLGLDSARFAVLTPYPGTPLFNRLDEEGRILTKDWSKYTRKNVVYEPKNMSKEELRKGFVKISNNFNSIPKIIYRNFKSLRLGYYPFLATVGRNLESYANRPKN